MSGSFIETLAMGVETYDRWSAHVESEDNAKRLEARQQQRQIEERFGATFAFNRVEVARLLVTMWRALEREELLDRTESRLDHIERCLEGD